MVGYFLMVFIENPILDAVRMSAFMRLKLVKFAP